MGTLNKILLIVTFVAGALSMFGALTLFHGCDSDTISNFTGQINQVTGGYSKTDSILVQTAPKDTIIIIDTVDRYKNRIVKVHDTLYKYLADTSLVASLLAQRDSLENELVKNDVEIIDSFATVFEKYNDSLTIFRSALKNTWDVRMNYGERNHLLSQTTHFRTIKESRSFLENPYLWGGVGMMLGYSLNELISGDKKDVIYLDRTAIGGKIGLKIDGRGNVYYNFR